MAGEAINPIFKTSSLELKDKYEEIRYSFIQEQKNKKAAEAANILMAGICENRTHPRGS